MRHHPTLIIFAASALAVFGALAWVTHHALKLEQQQRETRAEAQVQERVRLALWRMDSTASVLIARESARPYFEYQPFYATNRAYTRMLEEVRTGEVLVPSRLLTLHDRFVKLYFQIDTHGVMTSPQAPAGNLRDLAEASYITPEDVIGAEARLAELSALMTPANGSIADRRALKDVEKSDGAEQAQSFFGVGATPTTSAQAAGGATYKPAAEPANPPAPPASPQQSQTDLSSQTSRGPVQQSVDEYRARVSATEAVKETAQNEAQNSTRTQSRQALQTVAAPSAAGAPPARPGRAMTTNDRGADHSESAPADKAPAPATDGEVAPAPGTPTSPAESKPIDILEVLRRKYDAGKLFVDDQASPAPGVMIAGGTTGAPIHQGRERTDVFSNAHLDLGAFDPNLATLFGDTFRPKVDAEEAGVEVGSFTATWTARSAANGSAPQLLLLRDVRLGEGVVRQGCWVDWPALRADLLASVRDLLPQAQLVPVTPIMDEGGENLGRRLASVPAELVPGPVAAAAIVPIWTPLHNTLLVAWAGVLLAIAAIAFLLRAATDLAERRGRFVSAVTHELRTPLTTFVMYSQMLADGMVPEGEARQHYYTTLKREAGRLAGIVENVLEFARLSRRKRARTAPHTNGPMRAGELFDRLILPLKQRAEQASMTLDATLDGPDENASALVSTEERTLERILFNLVDNACKYGTTNSHDAPPPTITLRLRIDGPWAIFTVADDGPGISPLDRSRIFKAFERGEKQADGSIPGLGLGLALSQGLARDLGGDLTLLHAVPATFEVRVPR